MQRLLSSLWGTGMAHEIPSNVTFPFCTKRCIGVAVLHGRPLIHSGGYRWKPKLPLIAFFLSFSSRKLAERLHIIGVRKLSDLTADKHCQQWERWLQVQTHRQVLDSWCKHHDLFSYGKQESGWSISATQRPQYRQKKLSPPAISRPKQMMQRLRWQVFGNLWHP